MSMPIRRAVSFVVLGALSAAALTTAACSSDAPASVVVPTDGATPAAVDGASPAPVDGGTSADGGADATPAPGGRGITVTVNGSTVHTLTEGARAAVVGNGLGIQAAKTEGTKLYGITILLRKQSATESEDITPGPYACSASVPAAPYFWARIQYTSPDGTFQYGNPATCVLVTAYGAVGQPVIGTFEATLAGTGSEQESVTVKGTFDVDRTE